MSHPRKVLLALLPFALHGLAREIDAAMGLLLRATTPPSSFVGEALLVLTSSAAGVTGRVSLWIAAGALLWLAFAASRKAGKHFCPRWPRKTPT